MEPEFISMEDPPDMASTSFKVTVDELNSNRPVPEILDPVLNVAVAFDKTMEVKRLQLIVPEFMKLELLNAIAPVFN